MSCFFTAFGFSGAIEVFGTVPEVFAGGRE
jgi:hypothetical protein